MIVVAWAVAAVAVVVASVAVVRARRLERVAAAVPDLERRLDRTRTRVEESETLGSRLREAIEATRRPSRTMSPGDPGFGRRANLAEVARESQTILRHDEVNVGMETQVTEMAKNQIQHNLALTMMTAQFRLLNVAISERV